MFKNNIITYAVSAIVAVILLCIWIFWGYCDIDAPLDLILFIIWIIFIAAMVILLCRTEKARRRLMRTAIVVDNEFIFFPSISSVPLPAKLKISKLDMLAAVLGIIDYKNFDIYELDEDYKPQCSYIIYTDKYNSDKDIWSGTVVKDNVEIEFNNEDALMMLL